ncbi:hypothetical protein NKH48_34420, partial [Mesorhizobium sp. M1233]|uniref:hypothetical protein n=1 Tax=Mesorhizobium sp. M1233 TaxID=2957072 RepID=UPI00333D2002
ARPQRGGARRPMGNLGRCYGWFFWGNWRLMGAAPLVFETMSDIEIGPALNGLRIAGWKHNPNVFEPMPRTATKQDFRTPWRLPEEQAVSAGQPCILVQDTTAVALVVEKVDGLDLFPAPNDDPPKANPWILGDTRLLLEPDKVWRPRLNGPKTVAVDDTNRFVAGQTVFWENEAGSGFALIDAVDRGVARLAEVRPSGSSIPAGTIFYAVQDNTPEQFKANGNEWRFPLDAVDAHGDTKLRMIGTTAKGSLDPSEIVPVLEIARLNDASHDSYTRLAGVTASWLKVFDPDNKQKLATSIRRKSAATIVVPGSPGKLRGGDIVLAEDAKRQKEVLTVESIVERDDEFYVVLTERPSHIEDIAFFSGPFLRELRPLDWDRNPRRVGSSALVIEGSGALSGLLTAGKSMLIEPEIAAPDRLPFLASIVELDRVTRRVTLSCPPDAFEGYTVADVIIRANAVAVGHGEAFPRIILGNGDASRTNQLFLIAKREVSFVADQTIEAGVRAAVEVHIDGGRYEEVSTLADSESDDAHYETRITEDGHVRIQFGDGFHGRRLPTGKNNVICFCRVGTGARGNNIPSDGLAKPVRPHPCVDSVRQPLPTWGGQDGEDVEVIRVNAPAYLAALGRGVALVDFEHIARTQPGVWNARAFRVSEGADRRELIDVVVVPAAGAPLGDLGRVLEERLASLAAPGMQFRVFRFDAVPLRLGVRMRVNPKEFDPEAVEADMRAALFSTFALERRAPAQALFRSEVYAVVERVAGIVNSELVLFPNAVEPLISVGGNPLLPSRLGPGNQIWTVRPTDRQVVHLDGDGSGLDVIREVVS